MNQHIKQARSEIVHAMTQDPAAPVNFSRYRHRTLVDVLHSLVYQTDDVRIKNKKIRVVFSDSSETRPFPVGCLDLSAPPDEGLPVLRVGLNSGRHPEMDRFVEYYLFRNVDVEGMESIAEQEYAFEKGLEFLRNREWRDGGVLELHQTGLEPLVVGFYRAVVTDALDRRKNRLPSVTVIPRSWAPAEISIGRYVRSSFGNGVNDETLKRHITNFETAFKQLEPKIPGFFSLEHISEDVVVKWVPQRPMWDTELDFLVSSIPGKKNLVKDIFDLSQFKKHPHWGYRI